MAFPTTGLLDDFNRADGAPGANWGELSTSFTAFQILSNTLAATTGASGQLWSPSTFGPDSEIFVTLPALPGNGGNIDLFLGVAHTPGTTIIDGYDCEVTINTSGDETGQIYRLDDGAFTALGASFAFGLVAGDSLGFERIGTTLKFYHKPAAGAWTELASRTDGTYTGPGNIAMFTDRTNTRYDDFSGGTVVGGGPGPEPMLIRSPQTYLTR